MPDTPDNSDADTDMENDNLLVETLKPQQIVKHRTKKHMAVDDTLLESKQFPILVDLEGDVSYK